MISLKNLLVLFLSLGSFALAGQTVVIRDFKSKEALSNVHVENFRTRVVYNSDQNGEVALKNYDQDTLHVSRIGYADLFIYPNEIKKRIFYLRQSIIQMEDAVVIGVLGSTERKRDLPNQIEVIGSSEISFRNPQTSADVLQQSGKVAVQKSQMGGGSPILRGFEASRVLLVIDGVRMNNAIYRSGHLQNSITVDNAILKQTDLIFGPGAVMYGSDALGGVVHFETRDPVLADRADEQYVTGQARGRLSSANQERSFHADVSIANDKVGSLTSFTSSSYEDLRMGKWRQHGDESWGLIDEYVVFENGEDKIIPNSTPEIQRGSAFGQMDFLQKFLFKPTKTIALKANFHHSTSSKVPRFDALTEQSNGRPKWAEWYYGPQQRTLISLQGKFSDSTFLSDELTVTLAAQKIKEQRIQRRFGNNERSTQTDELWVYSLNADLRKRLKPRLNLNYGLEATYNDVSSDAQYFTLGEASVAPAPARLPDGGSSMHSEAVYASLTFKANKKIKFNGGLRFSNVGMHAEFVDTSWYSLPFSEIDMQNQAITGSLGVVYTPSKPWRITALVSSGFRSPNVDDAGKVREKSGYVQVPTTEAIPEKAYNAEMSIGKSFFKEKLQVEGTAYYTFLKDALVIRDAQLNGKDSLWVEGDMARIQTAQNTATAMIYGYSLGLKSELSDNWSLEANYNFTYGQDLEHDTALAHIPPAFGRAVVNFESRAFRGSLSCLFNGKKALDRYAPGTADNLDLALADGTPAWWTLNAYTSYLISPQLEATVAVENIFDLNYRPFASGISAPGRNFIVGLKANF